MVEKSDNGHVGVVCDDEVAKKEKNHGINPFFTEIINSILKERHNAQPSDIYK